MALLTIEANKSERERGGEPTKIVDISNSWISLFQQQKWKCLFHLTIFWLTHFTLAPYITKKSNQKAKKLFKRKKVQSPKKTWRPFLEHQHIRSNKHRWNLRNIPTKQDSKHFQKKSAFLVSLWILNWIFVVSIKKNLNKHFKSTKLKVGKNNSSVNTLRLN